MADAEASNSNACPVCKATIWIDNEDGRWRCEKCGHVSDSIRNDIEDDNDFNSKGRVHKKKKERTAKKAPPYYTQEWERKKFLVYAHQLILRKQIWWLVHELGLPEELEEIVRSLWEMRINVLADQIGASVEDLVFSSQARKAVLDSDNDDEEVKAKFTKPLPLKEMPKLIDTLGIIYLGMYILRLPVFLGDLLMWVNTGNLLYTHAFDELPKDMRVRMDRVGLERTRRRNLLKMDTLQNRTYRLVRAFQDELGMVLPPLNVPLCLYRMIQDLSLPPEVYPASKVVAAYAKFNFDYPTDTQQYTTRAIPDRKLAGVLVTTVKLLYPFDNVPRIPIVKNEPAVAVIDWAKWIRNRKKLKQKDPKFELTYPEGMKVSEHDIVQMKPPDLDHYMDWFEKHMLETRDFAIEDRNHENKMLKTMYDLFPLKGSVDTTVANAKPLSFEELQAAKIEALKATQRNLIHRQPVPEDDETHQPKFKHRPGNMYPLCKPGQLPPDGYMKEFMLAVGTLVGITLEDVVYVTFEVEKQVTKWVKQQGQKRKVKKKNPQLKTKNKFRVYR
jgi:RNA polymerase I-specific transcription initiation factor RRN7